MKKLTLQPPVYWSVDRDAVGPRLGRGWFLHTDPPYYQGSSIRLRVGMTALELGICRKTNKPVFPAVEVDAADIREWVAPNEEFQPQEQDEAEGSAESEAGQPDGADVDHGVVHVRGGESDDGVIEHVEVPDGSEQA